MPLLAFFSSHPDEIAKATIEQIVAMAGDGILKDESECSKELREYLGKATTSKLDTYITRCLANGFSNSGFVFQDIVNELGRRLDYKISNGRYRGTQKHVGFDGVWKSETKTTDAYTIKLDTIATYRDKLLLSKEIESPCSILIVVGRQDTGELEAQIRGSRHAWDIRVISAESLLKLVQLRKDSDELETGLKIRSLLTPMEFTRLDNLVDVMFTTATDVETGIVEAALETAGVPADENKSLATNSSGWEFTDIAELDGKRNKIIEAISQKIGSAFTKKSRALYWDTSHEKRVACSISKRYTRGAYSYWYAYHPEWDEFLGAGNDAFFILGCMDLSEAFALPLSFIRQQLPFLNTTTTKKEKTYWHVHLTDTAKGIALVIPGGGYASLDNFRLPIAPKA